MELQIEQLMEELVEGGGSDLHLAAGQPPYGRFSGALRPMREEKLSDGSLNAVVQSVEVELNLANPGPLFAERQERPP